MNNNVNNNDYYCYCDIRSCFLYNHLVNFSVHKENLVSIMESRHYLNMQVLPSCEHNILLE